MDNKTVGAELVKGLSFEVVATPQDNTIEMKNSSNMTPLNVKVRVRKKDDGPTVLRKGILAVERIDQPDSPIERLRLASSDQTIMSFNMLMEADLEKNRAAKKSKKNFFGICLGVQGEDDDTQYIPSAQLTDKNNSRSDTKVAKPKNVRPIVNTVVVDDTSTSYSSRKKDKYFGKCKPGGCLDPPFGEDKYAYQPQPKGLKSPTTRPDDVQDIKSDDVSGKLPLKRKANELSPAAKGIDQINNESNPVLSLYQGQPKIAVEENDSEYLITYPPALSSSGLLATDEKNEARRPSGARPSRKSFNEFSAQYFSPPRTPRDSKDSAKNDKEMNIKTKETLVKGQIKTVSPIDRQRGIDKSASKPLEVLETQGEAKSQENEKWDVILGSQVDFISDEADPQKTAPQHKSSPGNINSDVIRDLENGPNTDTWKLGANALGVTGLGAATAGLGIGIPRKDFSLGQDQEYANTENLQIEAKDSNFQYSESTPHKTYYPEHAETTQSADKGINFGLGMSPVMPQISSMTDDTFQNGMAVTTGSEGGATHKSSPKYESTPRNLEPTEMFGDVERNSSLTRAPKQNSTGGDFSPRGLTEFGSSDRGFSHEGTPMYKGIVNDLTSKEMPRAIEKDRPSLTSKPEQYNSGQDLSIRGLAMTASSNKGSSERSSSNTRSPEIEDIEGDHSSRKITKTGSLDKGSSHMGTVIYKDRDESLSQKGITTASNIQMPINEHKEDQRSNRRALRDGSKTSILNKKAQERDFMSNYENKETVGDLASTTADMSGTSGADFWSKGSRSTVAELANTEEPGVDPQLMEKINTDEYRAHKSRSKSESFNSEHPPNYIDDYKSNDITGRNDSNNRLKSRNGIENNAVEYSASGTIITEGLNESSRRQKPKLGHRRKSDSHDRDNPYAKQITDVAGYQMTHSGRADRASYVNNAYETGSGIHDASFGSNTTKTPSDVTSQFRENKNSNRSLGAEVDKQSPGDNFRQLKTSESGPPSASSDDMSSHNTGGQNKKYMDPEEDHTDNKFNFEAQSESGSRYLRSGGRTEYDDVQRNTIPETQSRESIFLNFAFQTDLDENQTTIKTLDSSKNQDSSNVIFVKSLIRPQDKGGVAVKIGSKHVMSIEIKPASISQLSLDRKSKTPKSITKFDSGKSDYSSSGVSLKDIGSDPHAALSVVFRQELVPLQSVIKNLKNDIDSLAAQQTKLRDKLVQGPSRSKQAPRKCGCLKRISSTRTE